MRKSLFIAAMLLAATPVQAKNDDVFVRQISVSGNCYKEMIPDRGGINLVADITNTKDLKAAVDSATKIYESVKAKVNALKLKDLELTTSEYSVMPINEWENNKQIFKGYRARIGLMVQTSETGRLGEVTAIGAAEGVRDVGALQLFVSRAASKQAMQDCLSDAAIDARKNAERIAAALNVKLGDVLTFTQEGAAPPPMVPMVRNMMKAEAAMASDASGPGIEAGKQTLNLNVQASFEVK